MTVPNSTVPVHSSLTFLVMILMTPPMASVPYNVDAGPRIISIRSIAAIGGKIFFSNPLSSPLGFTSLEY